MSKIIEFYTASWCGPCKRVEPLVTEVAKKKDIQLHKIIVDDNPGKAQENGVNVIPTVLLVEAGEILARIQGIKTKAEFRKVLK